MLVADVMLFWSADGSRASCPLFVDEILSAGLQFRDNLAQRGSSFLNFIRTK